MAGNATAKPHYVDVLNTLALAEKRAGIFLGAWVAKTPDSDLAARLSLIADRETSHYHVIKRRIVEMGYDLVEQDDPEFAETVRVSASDMPDLEKIRWQQARQETPEIQTLNREFRALVTDEAVDPLTRSLLRWFIDEETDSGRILHEVYSRIENSPAS